MSDQQKVNSAQGDAHDACLRAEAEAAELEARYEEVWLALKGRDERIAALERERDEARAEAAALWQPIVQLLAHFKFEQDDDGSIRVEFQMVRGDRAWVDYSNSSSGIFTHVFRLRELEHAGNAGKDFLDRLRRVEKERDDLKERLQQQFDQKGLWDGTFRQIRQRLPDKSRSL